MKNLFVLGIMLMLVGCSTAQAPGSQIEASDSSEAKTIDEIVEDNADFYEPIEEMSNNLNDAVASGDVANCAKLAEPQFRKNCESMILAASGDCDAGSDNEVVIMCEQMLGIQ